MRTSPTRRSVLRLLAGVAPLLQSALAASTAQGQAAPRDQGIGGTGMMRTDPQTESPLGEGDRGIGGTGVIGTIRQFGSIIVNDLRIAYQPGVAVRIDGEQATAADLKIGQVVQVVARPEDAGLATQRIEVTSEVVGPVDWAAPGRLVVLGQRVSTAELTGDWKPGTRVAVSGLRRTDGVIVASLIEPRSSGPDRVAGPVRRDGAAVMIGGLRLTGAEALPVGKRAVVTGAAANGVLGVTNLAQVGLPFPPGLKRVSIEGYIGRAGTKLDLGSGLAVTGKAEPSVPRTGSVHAVITANVTRGGGLTVDRLRFDGRREPEEPRLDGPRFERERDQLDLRGLPEEAPGRFGAKPEGGEQPVFRVDPRTETDDAPGGSGSNNPNSLGGGSSNLGNRGIGGPGFPGGAPGGPGGGPGGPGGGPGGPGAAGGGGPGRPR
ncbi:DUF5666 domain-containing protein [Methylobacterium sp. GC_Met_3]|uniref:DUF5666 domain-containing protein n=2 Tax=unclassified Methylobacterium TaxID=2615210 RepID=UPI00226AEA18